MDESRKLAISIIDEFDELLTKKGISVPCDDEHEEKIRYEEDNTSSIYGMEYATLEDAITILIDEYLDDNYKNENDDEYDYCYECSGYGDDYSVNDDGDLVCNCFDCPNNPCNYDD